MYFKKALNIVIQKKYLNPIILTSVYNALGGVYYKIGDYDLAEDFFRRSLQLATENELKLNQAIATNNIADVNRKELKYYKALLSYKQATQLFEDIYGKESIESAFMYNNIANVYNDMWEIELAKRYYLQSLNIRKKLLGDKHFRISQSYQNIGILEMGNKKFHKALNCFQESLISNVFQFENIDINKNPSLQMFIISHVDLLETISLKAEAFYELWNINRDSLELLELSLKNYDFALDISDHIRNSYYSISSKMLLNRITQQLYPKALKASYDYYKIDCELGFEKLFEHIERGKCIILYSSLLDAEAKNASNIPNTLKELERKIKDQINGYSILIKQSNLLCDSSRILHFESQLFSLIKQHDSLINHFENKYTKYYELKYDISVLSLNEIQKLLKPEEAIIEFFITDTLIYTCVISQDNKQALAMKNNIILYSTIRDYNSNIKLAELDKFLYASKILYNELFSPIHQTLQGKNRLIIIPHDILFNVPFETLISNTINEQRIFDFSKNQYLINDYEIVYNYSVNLWADSRKTALEKDYSKQSDFLGFAPVFDNSNGYIISNNSSDSTLYGTPQRNTNSSQLRFKKLPYSEKEVKEIIELFDSKNLGSKGYFFSEATESNFRSEVHKYKYIHIATHGYINDEYPDLSGLTFYQSQNSVYNSIGNYTIDKFKLIEPADIKNDGILYLNEIYNLQMNSDLIVLSACNTGVGKFVKGEGIMAMTRGFTYAGANNIIFSVWKVSDKHTKELMITFYKNMLNSKRYSKSLQIAKTKMISNINTSFPLLWGGFMLIGE